MFVLSVTAWIQKEDLKPIRRKVFQFYLKLRDPDSERYQTTARAEDNFRVLD
jgi:hypothetical protein